MAAHAAEATKSNNETEAAVGGRIGRNRRNTTFTIFRQKGGVDPETMDISIPARCSHCIVRAAGADAATQSAIGSKMTPTAKQTFLTILASAGTTLKNMTPTAKETLLTLFITTGATLIGIREVHHPRPDILMQRAATLREGAHPILGATGCFLVFGLFGAGIGTAWGRYSSRHDKCELPIKAMINSHPMLRHHINSWLGHKLG